jgi:hypothetical protein
MNHQRFGFIQEQAEEILVLFQSKYKFPNSPPVLVDMIVQDLGLQCRTQGLGFLDNRTRGALSVDDRVIYLDERCHQHQYAFTVAHEIGHWILHEGNHQLYMGGAQGIPLSHFFGNTRFKTKEEENNHQEIYANQFAAALLVPRPFLFSETRRYQVIDAKAVDEIAKVFCVSRQAMICRIKDLCQHGEWTGPRVDEGSIDGLQATVTRRDQTRRGATQPSLFRHLAQTQLVKRGDVAISADYLHRQRQAQVRRADHPKPYVVEFAGTPNAGKDTLIGIATDRLKDVYGYKVEIVDEVVRTYPPSRCWDINGLYRYVSVTGTKLIEAAIDNPGHADFVILNRGIFDALTFVYAHCGEGRITEDQKHVLMEYLLLDRVVGLIDEVFLLLISPLEALQREYTSKRRHVATWAMLDGVDFGSILPQRVLNKEMLDRLNAAYIKMYQEYFENEGHRRFKEVHLLDFTDEEGVSVEEATKRLAQVFPSLEFPKLQRPLFGHNGRSHKQLWNQDESALQLPLFDT